MKFLSIRHLFSQATNTIIRFPLAIFSSIAGSFCLLMMTDMKNEVIELQRLVPMVMTFSLGLVSFTGLSMFTERYSMRKTTVLFFQIALLFLMIYYFYSLPVSLTIKDIAQFVILSLSAHLGVSFAPYLVNSEVNGFWQYNKTIFLRILNAVLYSSVLFIGLSLALLAIDNLFVAHLGDKIYVRLWIVLAGVFNTWFFLSGMPKNIAELQLVNEYPKGLRIFTSYVLLPLVTIYLLILYVYAGKIIFTAHWPRGWVSYLVIGFSTAGILALLLVWPLREDDKYKWIHSYTKGFFIALFPLIILLAFSIGRRVKDYGITENRYFIIVLAIWLFINACYFLLSRLKNIKFIPMTLFCTALIAGFGPFNSFQISKRSQLEKLTSLLQKNKLLHNGKIIKREHTIKLKDDNQMASIIDYLADVHGVSSMQKLFTQNLDSIIKVRSTGGRYVDESHEVQTLAGIFSNSDFDNQDNNDGGEGFSYSSVRENVVKVEGYDYSFPCSVYTNDNKVVFTGSEKLDSVEFTWKYKADDWDVNAGYGDNSTLVFRFEPLLDSLQKIYGYSNFQVLPSQMVLTATNELIKAQWQINGLKGVRYSEDSTVRISSIDGILLLDFKAK